jgi:hypothetical protein
MEIYETAREFMHRAGNINQWVNGYPSQKLIEEDIEAVPPHPTKRLVKWDPSF